MNSICIYLGFYTTFLFAVRNVSLFHYTLFEAIILVHYIPLFSPIFSWHKTMERPTDTNQTLNPGLLTCHAE